MKAHDTVTTVVDQDFDSARSDALTRTAPICRNGSRASSPGRNQQQSRHELEAVISKLQREKEATQDQLEKVCVV